MSKFFQFLGDLLGAEEGGDKKKDSGKWCKGGGRRVQEMPFLAIIILEWPKCETQSVKTFKQIMNQNELCSFSFS